MYILKSEMFLCNLETGDVHINSLWQDLDWFMQYFRWIRELREKKVLYFLLEQQKRLQLFNKKHYFLIFLLAISVKQPWCDAALGVFFGNLLLSYYA